MKTLNDYSIEGIKADYAAHNEGPGDWFGKSEMRYFHTVFESDVYNTPCEGNMAYFVTSERHSLDEPKMYTVRSYDFSTHDVHTVGKFAQEPSKKIAISRARNLAGW